MTRFLFTFPSELKESLEEAFKAEKADMEKVRLGRRMRMLNWAYKKQFGFDMNVTFDYEFVSDTEAIIDVISSADSFVKPEVMLEKMKEYTKTDSRIRIEVVR